MIFLGHHQLGLLDMVMETGSLDTQGELLESKLFMYHLSCTGFAEVMGSNPMQAWIFFRPYCCYCLSSVHYCKDRFHVHYFKDCHLQVILNSLSISSKPCWVSKMVTYSADRRVPYFVDFQCFGKTFIKWHVVKWCFLQTVQRSCKNIFK